VSGDRHQDKRCGCDQRKTDGGPIATDALCKPRHAERRGQQPNWHHRGIGPDQKIAEWFLLEDQREQRRRQSPVIGAKPEETGSRESMRSPAGFGAN